jgi:hypothetical protein
MVFLKALGGGVVGAIIMWVVVLSFRMWRIHVAGAQHGLTGLGATAGGWTLLLHSPAVLLLLTGAFGFGLYLGAR